MRPFEALLRDPWWIFTTWKLVSAIGETYGFSILALVRINVRFGVMLGCMFISIAFLLTDVGVNAARITVASGINPYWRLALVFKCASDTIFLDNFKSVLDDIIARKLSSAGNGTARNATHETRMGSHSSMRGDPTLVNCAPILGLIPEPTMEKSRSKSFNPFKLHHRTETVPGIQEQREEPTRPQVRKPSHESWHRYQELLRTPEAVVCGSRHVPRVMHVGCRCSRDRNS